MIKGKKEFDNDGKVKGKQTINSVLGFVCMSLIIASHKLRKLVVSAFLASLGFLTHDESSSPSFN